MRHFTEAACARWLIALMAAVLLGNTATAAADELKPYKATYNGIWHGMTVGVSTLQL